MTDNTVIPQDRNLTEEDFAQLKRVRNNFLTSTDSYMLMNDLPDSLLEKITSYRNTIRNIDSKFGTEWVKESDIEWPDIPTELITKHTVPFVPPPGSTVEV